MKGQRRKVNQWNEKKANGNNRKQNDTIKEHEGKQMKRKQCEEKRTMKTMERGNKGKENKIDWAGGLVSARVYNGVGV